MESELRGAWLAMEISRWQPSAPFRGAELAQWREHQLRATCRLEKLVVTLEMVKVVRGEEEGVRCESLNHALSMFKSGSDIAVDPWQCERCKRWMCAACEGNADDELCDDCWSESQLGCEQDEEQT